ncbi:MAG: class I SAM-dependent methyltransferase [Oscillospiraceae bacterium]|nr:class I SAM-dependent methyltransferase [Oscillospiraceae bacterium]
MKDFKLVRKVYQKIFKRKMEHEIIPDKEELVNLDEEKVNGITSNNISEQNDNEAKIKKYDTQDIVRTFEELDIALDKYNSCRELFIFDVHSFFKLFDNGDGNPYVNDPFSKEYENYEMCFFEFLANKQYTFDNEGPQSHNSHDLHIINTISSKHPDFFMPVEKKIDRFQTYNSLLSILTDEISCFNEKQILEMGCGWGALASFFETLDCNYFAVDASESFVEFTKRRLYTENSKKQIYLKSFYDISDICLKFDIVIFEESFHHCGEPQKLLDTINKNTTPDAVLIFINEPIVDGYDRPWGLVRYDYETIAMIRVRGWLEYGYELSFFSELLNKYGWQIVKTGKIIVAKRL